MKACSPSPLISALALWLGCVLSTANVHAQGDAIHISDANLEGRIRQTLAIPTDPITAADMQLLTDPVAEELDIADLTGLEHATTSPPSTSVTMTSSTSPRSPASPR